jgi:hypothetical protein
VRGQVSLHVAACNIEAVTDLDANLMVVLCDDKQRAVVDLPAANLPGFCNPERILLDAFGLRRWYNQHRPLRASRLFNVCVNAAISAADSVPV